MWVSVKDRLPKENGRYKIRDIKGHEEYTVFMKMFQSFFYNKPIKEWFEEEYNV